MKRLFILLSVVFILINSTAFAGDTDIFTTEEVILKDDIYYHTQTDEPINGILKEFYESGVLRSEFDIIDGIKNGTGKEYYSSGELESEAQYQDGKEDGVTKFYYESGALKYETPHKNGQYHGILKAYYENGKLKDQAQMENGKVLWGYKYDENTGIRTKMTNQDYDDNGFEY